MKCRNCATSIVADADGNWMHIPTIADRPCDDPARPTETDMAILAWLEDTAERWVHGLPPHSAPPEGVDEAWIDRPLDDPRCTPTMIRFRAVLVDRSVLYVSRDFNFTAIEVL